MIYLKHELTLFVHQSCVRSNWNFVVEKGSFVPDLKSAYSAHGFTA